MKWFAVLAVTLSVAYSQNMYVSIGVVDSSSLKLVPKEFLSPDIDRGDLLKVRKDNCLKIQVNNESKVQQKIMNAGLYKIAILQNSNTDTIWTSVNEWDTLEYFPIFLENKFKNRSLKDGDTISVIPFFKTGPNIFTPRVFYGCFAPVQAIKAIVQINDYNKATPAGPYVYILDLKKGIKNNQLQQLPFDYKRGQLPLLQDSNWLNIRFKDNDSIFKRIQDVGLKKVILKSFNSPKDTVVVDVNLPLNDTSTSFQVEFRTVLKNNKVFSKCTLAVSLEFNDTAKTKYNLYPTSFYSLIKIKVTELYQSKISFPGMWYPFLTIFATNGKLSDDGLTFSILPISVAWGRKHYYSPDFYLGNSGILNWVATTDKEGNTFNLTGISFGYLFDINNIIVTGISTGVQIKKDPKWTGPLLIFGFQPSFFEFLKSNKK